MCPHNGSPLLTSDIQPEVCQSNPSTRFSETSIICTPPDEMNILPWNPKPQLHQRDTLCHLLRIHFNILNDQMSMNIIRGRKVDKSS